MRTKITSMEWQRVMRCGGNKSQVDKMNELHVSRFQTSFLEINESFCFLNSVTFLMKSPQRFSLQPII